MPSRSFTKSPESVRAARAYVVQSLPELDAELHQLAALLVSELATNAVLYGQGDIRIAVRYSVRDQRARIEVHDEGSGDPVLKRPGKTAEHGRGLQLVAALSAGWGIDSSAGHAGKTVWFEVDGQRANSQSSARPARRLHH